MAHYNLLDMDLSTFAELSRKWHNSINGTANVTPVLNMSDSETTIEPYRMRWKMFWTNNSYGVKDWRHEYGVRRFNYTLNAGVRICYVQIPVKLKASGGGTGYYFTGDTIDFYLPVSNSINPLVSYPHQSVKNSTMRSIFKTDGSIDRYIGPTAFDGTQWNTIDKSDTNNFQLMTEARLNNLNTYGFMPMSSDVLTAVKRIFNGKQYGTPATYLETSYSNPQNGHVHFFRNFLGSPYGGDGNTNTELIILAPTMFDAPVFRYDNATGIQAYLDNGDEGGSIDPFDPNNPSVVTVTDFNTNFDAYVTLGDPAQPYAGFTNIHWSVRALNEQYNEARDILAGMYSLDVVTAGYPWTYFKRTQAQVPVASFTKATPNNSESYNPFQFFFTEYGTQDGTQNQHSGIFLIDYAYKEGSRSKCKIRQVKFKTGDPFTTAWQTEGVELSRVSIGTDAYKYTASTGETLTIYFRGITLEDLNKTDDGYKENPDTEASPTEGDVAIVSGSGLNTFSISKAQFDLINKALWSTDWTQVFKSSTIDPIKCVITCKGIKFANAGSGDVPIIIANRDTDVSSGVVNPVKSYTIDNCYIPAINGDFTDISLMRVRCYLPYIGWVDLPSAEVVGRLAYNGVQAVNKRLTFKYIVDFIDGACRCVVSVNGTERWMFDGNCAVDIPVTSDNHTNAIGTAIKSGLATTLSIATGVAGAISGNAGAVAGGVVGAINSAPNMLPTYEYSASASPSGYVNGSCNSHIMIVCEIPNVQIPNGFARKVGRPCERNLSLGSLVGFTQCKNVNVSGINATTEELTMIAHELNSGVYL